MEYFGDGDLFDYIEELNDNDLLLDESEVRRIFRQMALGVKFLHDRNIAHRDIKPENFIIKKQHSSLTTCAEPGVARIDFVKMIDFGHAVHFADHQKLTEALGTNRYRPPEIFDPYLTTVPREAHGRFKHAYQHKRVSCSYLAPPADVYALGISLFNLLEGAHPDHGGELKNLRFFTDWKLLARKVSEDAKNLVRDMLADDPLNRLTIDQVDQLKFNFNLVIILRAKSAFNNKFRYCFSSFSRQNILNRYSNTVG